MATTDFPKLIDEVDDLVGEELVRTQGVKQDEGTLATTPLDVDENDGECCDSLSSAEDSPKDEDIDDEKEDTEEYDVIGYFSSASTPLPTASAQPKRSILKKTIEEPRLAALPPKPKLGLRMRRCVSEPSKVCSEESKMKRVKSASTLTRNVAFTTVEFRHYDCTLGDNPSCSYGPPIQLDWSFVKVPAMDLEDYESDRMGKRRNLRQMLLSYYTRVNILTWCFGHSEAELKTATKEVNRTKLRRSVTRAFLPMQKVEEVVQSARRKVKRAVGAAPPKRRPVLPPEMRRSSTNLMTSEELKQFSGLELEDETLIT